MAKWLRSLRSKSTIMMFSARSFSEVSRSRRSSASSVGSADPPRAPFIGPPAAVGENPEEALGRGARDDQLAEPEVTGKWCRIAASQRPIALPRVQPAGRCFKHCGQTDLVRVAFADFMLGVGDFALIVRGAVTASEFRSRLGNMLDGGSRGG